MIYFVGSKFFKTVVAFAALAAAGPGCGDPHCGHSHAASTKASTGDEHDDTMFAHKEHDHAAQEHAHHDHAAHGPPEVTEEMFQTAKTEMGITDEEFQQVVDLMAGVPAEWKDRSDESTAKMFVHSYLNAEYDPKLDGDVPPEKTKEALIKELKTLVEEEIPTMQAEQTAHMERDAEAKKAAEEQALDALDADSAEKVEETKSEEEMPVEEEKKAEL
jgi:hypothetical protein